jgi:TorA maturation chaperone TorD
MKDQQVHPELVTADIYRLLAACYYQPTEAFLEENVFAQLAELLALDAADHAATAEEMERIFRQVGAQALLLDYTRLFLGPFQIPAKPYGSVYLDGAHVVMGDSTMQALAAYRDGGFEVAADFSEMPDHVAVELEFLYLLSFKIGQPGGTEGDRLSAVKKGFLNDHIGRWIPGLADAMRKHAETDYYRLLADLTERFVLEEMQSREPVRSQ